MRVWLVIYSSHYQKYIHSEDCQKTILNAKLKHNIDLLFINKALIEIRIINNAAKLYYDDSEVTLLPDFVILRSGAGVFGAFLDINAIPYTNSLSSSQISGNKALTHIYLSKLGVKMPKTIINYSNNEKDYDYHKIATVLGNKIIIKAVAGEGGQSVHMVDNASDFKKYIEKHNYQCLFQEYLECSRGKDIRVVVIGKRFIHALKRENSSDFRSNVHCGGKITRFDCPIELQKKAIEIAKALNLDICGVDFLFGPDKDFYFTETNTVPCLLDFVETTDFSFNELIDILVSENVIRKKF